MPLDLVTNEEEHCRNSAPAWRLDHMKNSHAINLLEDPKSIESSLRRSGLPAKLFKATGRLPTVDLYGCCGRVLHPYARWIRNGAGTSHTPIAAKRQTGDPVVLGP
jgi:hypothetical protein